MAASIIDDYRKKLDEEMTFVRQSMFVPRRYPHPDYRLNGELHLGRRLGLSEWDAYAMGYKASADMVVEKISEQHHMPSYMVYPVVFLYRHYLELRLKELLVGSSRLLGNSYKIPRLHDLMPLWKEVRTNLEQIWTSEETRVVHEHIENRRWVIRLPLPSRQQNRSSHSGLPNRDQHKASERCGSSYF